MYEIDVDEDEVCIKPTTFELEYECNFPPNYTAEQIAQLEKDYVDTFKKK